MPAWSSSFPRFFIYCWVLDRNSVDPLLQMHLISALPLPVLLFSFCYMSYEIPQTVEHSLAASFLSTEALLLALAHIPVSALEVVTCLHGWLLISCWSYKQCICHQRSATFTIGIYSHIHLFLQKKRETWLRAHQIKSRGMHQICFSLSSWCMVKDLPLSVHPSPLGISHLDALLATKIQKTVVDILPTPFFFVFLLTAIRENSRTDQFYIQIKLTWIQALWDTNLNAIIFFEKILVEPGGRTFFVHSLLSPFGKTILITLRFFDHHQRHQNNPLLLLLLLLIHISESNPQLWNEGFL